MSWSGSLRMSKAKMCFLRAGCVPIKIASRLLVSDSRSCPGGSKASGVTCSCLWCWWYCGKRWRGRTYLCRRPLFWISWCWVGKLFVLCRHQSRCLSLDPVCLSLGWLFIRRIPLSARPVGCIPPPENFKACPCLSNYPGSGPHCRSNH